MKETIRLDKEIQYLIKDLKYLWIKKAENNLKLLKLNRSSEERKKATYKELEQDLEEEKNLTEKEQIIRALQWMEYDLKEIIERQEEKINE